MPSTEGATLEEGYEVPTPTAPEQGESVWLHHFGELRQMGSGGTVLATVRGPGV